MATARRFTHEPAFVLHRYDWSESSLILEVFTRQHGRVALVAKGARRPHSQLRGVLMAFQPLVMDWSGGGEVKTLASQTDRMKLVEIGKSSEGRTQYIAIVSTPQNLANLDRYQEIAPKVQEVFERYGLTYTTGPLPTQVASAWLKIIRLSLPNELITAS